MKKLYSLLLVILTLCYTQAARAEVSTVVEGDRTTIYSTDTTGVITLPDWSISPVEPGSGYRLDILILRVNVKPGTRISFDWRMSISMSYSGFTIQQDEELLLRTSTGKMSGCKDIVFTKEGMASFYFSYYSDDYDTGGNANDVCSVSNITIDHEAASRPDADLPFRTSNLTADGQFADNAVWYNMAIKATDNYMMVTGDNVSTSKTAADQPEYYWTFTGNEEEGYQIYNYAAGPTRPLTLAAHSSDTPVTMGGEGDSHFQVAKNSTGYVFYLPEDSCSFYISTKSKSLVSTYAPSSKKVIFTYAHPRCFFERKPQPVFIPIENIELNYQSEVELGRNVFIAYTLNPSNTTDTDVAYEVLEAPKGFDGKLYDYYDGYFYFQAKLAGTYKIKVYSVAHPEVYAIAETTVREPVKVTDIQLDATSITMKPGERRQINVTVLPADADNTNYTWSNTDPTVAAIDASDHIIAFSNGTTTLTATAADGGGAKAELTVIVRDGSDSQEVDFARNYLYITHNDGTLTAVPKDYIESTTQNESSLTLSLMGGKRYTTADVTEVSEECPVELPHFRGYKFNDKFNGQLFKTAEVPEDQLAQDTITLPVMCIGKWLTASFQMPDEETKAWIGDVLQQSKVTRQRFDEPMTYTIGRDNWKRLSLLTDSEGAMTMKMMPFGTETTIVVDWATDHSTSTYTVPRIDITFGNGKWSSSNWISSKNVYKDATIKIDGAGVFPDMDETSIQIKGRGNSSWSNNANSKNPYHFKFEEAQKPLGMTKGKHWLLIANKQSGSMTTNAIAQRAADLLGMDYPCHFLPVELYINDSYRGSYNITERIGLANNSVDLDDDSQAAIIELDLYSDEVQNFNNQYGLPVKLKDAVEETTETHERAAEDFDWLTKHVDPWNESDFDGLVDIPSLASFLLTNELILNCELKHPKSVFLFSENIWDNTENSNEDPTPWHFGPLWDCDWAFGYQQTNNYFISSANMDYFQEMGYSDQMGYEPYYFWNGLRYGSAALDKEMYRQLYTFMTNGGLRELIDYCDDYYAFAKNSLTHNRQNATNERDGANYETTTKNAKTWLAKRVAELLSTYMPYDDVTGINDIRVDEPLAPSLTHYDTRNSSTPVYDLSGRRVTGILRPGIYVRNGKKFSVK